MNFFLQKQKSGLFAPIDDDDFRKSLKIDTGEIVKVEYWKKRNYEFHKKFFALVNMVFDNQEVFTNLDTLRKELTIESGFYTEYVDFQGVVQREAKSISFASMDEAEFSDLYGKFCDTVIRLMGWDTELIEENIESFL